MAHLNLQTTPEAGRSKEPPEPSQQIQEKRSSLYHSPTVGDVTLSSEDSPPQPRKGFLPYLMVEPK